MFENFAVFRKSPQNLCIVFKQRSESPQISAILRKTCANNAEQQLKKTCARKISHLGGAWGRLLGCALALRWPAAAANPCAFYGVGLCQRLTGVPLASGALSVFGFCGCLRKFCGILRILRICLGNFADFCGILWICLRNVAEFRGQTLRAPGPKVTSVRL